jgi:hypothetical protein
MNTTNFRLKHRKKIFLCLLNSLIFSRFKNYKELINFIINNKSIYYMKANRNNTKDNIQLFFLHKKIYIFKKLIFLFFINYISKFFLCFL